MLRTIRIYGRLAKFLKRRKFTAEVASAAEAVRFLLANFPHLEPELAQGHYRVSVGGYDLGEDELHHPSGQQEIRLIPVVAGAGAVGKIIAGVALVALAIVNPFGAAAIAGVALSTIAFGVGASLVLGGVAQLLSPVPKVSATETDPRRQQSFNFSGIQNTSAEGTPVPIVYGEVITGSVTVSVGIDTVQI